MRFLSPVLLLFALVLPAFCARTTMQWERLHTSAVPTRLLSRLGVTHITRFGYTRDGEQKNVPDPTFPPGLTDVVPVDSTHTLLLRGTAAGRVAFRARVALQDKQMLLPRLHVAASVQDAPPAGDSQSAEGRSDSAATGEEGFSADEPDAPFVLSVPDGSGTRLYRCDVDDAPGGSYVVRVQVNLAAATANAAAGAPTSPPVWSAAHTFPVQAGVPALWPDAADFRQSERRRLHLPLPAAAEADRVLRVVVSPAGAAAPVAVSPAAVVH